MKTKFNKLLGMLALGVFSLTSCDSFLDMQNTEQLTFDKIWTKKSYVEGYFSKCFNGMPDLLAPPSYIDNCAADEALGSWMTSSQYAFKAHNNGSWNVSSPAGDNLSQMYEQIRHCTIFLQNVDRSLENKVFNITPEEVVKWKADAKFIRAYYYYLLLVRFGPIPIWGDVIADPNLSMEDLALPRKTLDQCIEYINTEWDLAAADLPDSYPLGSVATDHSGRPTKAIVKAMKARLALYAARPLFNSGGGYKPALPYASLKEKPNGEGERLFPEYDENKWRIAADMNKEAIDFAASAGHTGLYVDPTGNTFLSIYGIQAIKWNQEIIWGRHYGRGNLTNHCLPSGIQGFSSGLRYGGFSPSQRHVDRYANSEGIYAITGYQADGQPIIDQQSGYDEKGWTSFRNPACIKENTVPVSGASYKAGEARDTYNMYVNREPRFYMNILWNDSRWPHSPYPQIFFHTGSAGMPAGDNDFAASGPPNHDHSMTGYMVIKGLDRAGTAANTVPNAMVWSIIRLAELYLNYAEALNEIDPGNPDVLKYLNLVRVRAGIKAIGTDRETEVYGGIIGNKVEQRKMILREREVEFAFEQQRYNDMRMLLEAEETNNGPMYGMNKLATTSDKGGAFWKRTNCETRVFKPKHYLFPFIQKLLDRNKNLTQNYGW